MKHRKVMIIVVLLVIALGVVGFFKKASSPIIKPNESRIINPIIISGRIVDENNNPMQGIVVSIGGTGVVSDSAGRYSLKLDKEGRLRVYFDNPKTEQQYEIAGTHEQSIFLFSGDNKQRDFIIKPVRP